MRTVFAAAALLGADVATGFAAPAPARLPPDEIQKAFFTGQPFTAATPSGIAFKMVFLPSGRVTREPTGRTGVRGEGTWKLDKSGFCTTWKNSKPNCFVLVSTGDNKWSVMKGPGVVAVWSK
ncbi:MAG: hypothetical protein FJX62_20630 [Alphaproteobacteria bacterium]|nr:hypothetical protein [Alphaproteobacteria bacterium]